MSDLRPTGEKIKLGNNEYGMRFTLNAIDEIQEHFNIPISQMPELFADERKQIRNLRYLISVLINEDIDCVNDETGSKTPHIDEKYVGRHIDTKNLTGMMSDIMRTFTGGVPISDEDADPNAATVQSKN